MNLSEMIFRRKFSLNFYKNLSCPLAEMTFTTDFTETNRGDLYPIIKISEGAEESVLHDGYRVKGSATRLFAAFFPYATYKMTVSELSGSAGFIFNAPDTSATLLMRASGSKREITILHDDGEQMLAMPEKCSGEVELTVSLRPGNFDIFYTVKGVTDYLGSFKVPSFKESTRNDFYQPAKVLVTLTDAFVTKVSSCIDCGIGQADIRPLKYENGDVITERGRVFLTLSTRLTEGGYQAVVSWVPGTLDFKMEGALFYAADDKRIHGDVATAIVLDRRDGVWHLWQRSGACGHVLAYTSFKSDIRYGVNVIDVVGLPHMTGADIDDTLFLGKKGDEDPEFIYDEKRKKWLFCLCRVTEATRKYQYYFFESDRPDTGYKWIGCGPQGEETGGSIVKHEGKLYFVCGNSFSAKSDYRVYEWGKFDKFENLKTDFPDGGFRGWGTIIPVNVGTRRRYYWLTFDRFLTSKIFNWSYGNVYCFEAEGIYKPE